MKTAEMNDIVMYDAADISRMFNLSRTQAYKLLSASGFPTIKLNRKILVPKARLEKWIEQNCGKQFDF